MKPIVSMTVLLLAGTAAAQASVPDAVLAATGTARRDNQRVLLVTGDDGIRAQLQGPLSRLILYEYTVAELPADSPYSEPFRPEGTQGAFVAILDDRYRCLDARSVAELRDPEQTRAFLTGHQAEPENAAALYQQALSVARKTNRHVFVHLSAPW